jgi:hypothetical protein
MNEIEQMRPQIEVEPHLEPSLEKDSLSGLSEAELVTRGLRLVETALIQGSDANMESALRGYRWFAQSTGGDPLEFVSDLESLVAYLNKAEGAAAERVRAARNGVGEVRWHTGQPPALKEAQADLQAIHVLREMAEKDLGVVQVLKTKIAVYAPNTNTEEVSPESPGLMLERARSAMSAVTLIMRRLDEMAESANRDANSAVQEMEAPLGNQMLQGNGDDMRSAYDRAQGHGRSLLGEAREIREDVAAAKRALIAVTGKRATPSEEDTDALYRLVADMERAEAEELGGYAEREKGSLMGPERKQLELGRQAAARHLEGLADFRSLLETPEGRNYLNVSKCIRTRT